MVKLIDVARKARVSEATASLALNRKPGVNAKTRERVLKAAKSLGYSPNTLARGLATHRTHSIGLVVTDIENPFFGSLTRHIDEFSLEAGYNLILSVSNDELDLEARIIQDFIGKRVDGVIIVPTILPRRDLSYFENLKKHHIPYVFSTPYYPGVPCECVMTNLEEGSYALCQHLLKLGHRDILLLVSNNREVVPSKLRIQGCRKAFEEHGLVLDRRRVVECERTDFDCGYTTTLRIMKKGKPDTVMAINDIMALGGQTGDQGAGVRHPRGDLGGRLRRRDLLLHPRDPPDHRAAEHPADRQADGGTAAQTDQGQAGRRRSALGPAESGHSQINGRLPAEELS